jgi:hypothetical protein
MKKRRESGSGIERGVSTSLSTENLAAHTAKTQSNNNNEDTDCRPNSTGLPISRGSRGKTGLSSRGTQKSSVLGDIASESFPINNNKSNNVSRTTTRDGCRLQTGFSLKFIYNLDGIVIPQKLLYDDYLGLNPAKVVDLRGWIVSKGIFKQLEVNCKPILTELYLQDTIGFQPKMLEYIRGSPKLKIINLYNTNITITFQAAQILGSLTRLIDLNISECTVDITSFSIICNTCNNLRTLTCQACPGLDDFCLQALGSCMQRFRKLNSIDLSRGIDYSDEGYLTVLNATPKLLTKLNMSNTKILSSLAVTALRTKMPNLIYLDLSEMKLSQTCFEWITEGCNRLETLILTKCSNLDDIALARFGTKLQYLKKIILNSCGKITDIGLCEFFNQLKASLDLQLGDGLRYIDISSNIHLGGPPIIALAEYEAKAQSLNPGKGITDLKLNGLSMVTSPALLAMWKACTSIRNFSMAVEMSSTVTHRKSMMPHISDQILIEAQYFSLVDVSLSGCCLITDIGVCCLIEKCQEQLHSLDVSYCNGITDMTCYTLAQYVGKTLKNLNIGGCNKVTNHGIIALCTDHSDVKRKKRLIKSVIEDDHEIDAGAGAGAVTLSEKYKEYNTKSGVYSNDNLYDNNDAEPEDEVFSDTATATSTSYTKNKRQNPSLDKLNPFYHSSGCLKIEKLEMNGCYKVTDPGIVALSNLKNLYILSIRNLDNVTDSPLLLLSESCTKLKSLEISGLDMISINVVKSLSKYCYKLETLNCDLCNFTSGDFADVVRPRLPLGMPNNLRSKLDQRPRPIYEYNKFVVQTRECRFAAWILTKFGIYCIAWVRQRQCKRDRIAAIKQIKISYFNFLQRRRQLHYNGNKNQRTRCANILQQWAKQQLGNKIVMWKRYSLYKRSKKALIMQRIFRGHMARKRTKKIFEKLFYYYNLIGHMAHKIWILHYARIFNKKHILIQSVGRMFPHKLTFILTKRSIITLQIKIRNYLKRRRGCRGCIQYLIREIGGQESSANVIRKNWRIKMFNKQMSTFVFICAIYWRTLDDEKDWRQVQLQAWWRGQMVRNENWRIRELPKMRERKALKIQSIWYRYLTRCWYIPFKKKLKYHMTLWRKWVNSCCHMRLGAITRPLQKTYKLYYFNLKRLRSNITISRYYRGYVARKKLADYKYIIDTKYAGRIVRQYRLYKGRQWRKYMHALRHMSAWKIQHIIHVLFDGEAMKRIQSKTAARRRKEILEEKSRLLNVIRYNCLEKRKAEFMFIFAKRIQKRFRKFSYIRMKKAEALENRKRATEEATEEIHQIKASRWLAEVFKPLAGVTSAISNTISTLVEGRSDQISKSDEPRLTNAILRYHTRSIVQVGVTNIHITYGDGESNSYALAQNMLRTSGKPYMNKCDIDLSGVYRLKVFIWYMIGKGVDCITKFEINRKPGSSSLAQLRSRANNMLSQFIRIIWHPSLDFEFRASQTIKAGLGGFAITSLEVVTNEEDGDDLELKGYTKLAVLEPYGFPAIIYGLSRVPENQDDIFKLGMLQKTEWCDSRMMKLIYTYNLANSDVYALRRVFESILGSSLQETVRVKDIFDFFGGFELNQIAKWMVEAVKPNRLNELTFSEYAHLVISTSMFGTKEIMRFLFGCIDTKSNAFIKRDQFTELIDYMSSGNQNPNVWLLQYDNYKDKKLDSLFFTGFCNFCTEYRAVMWGPEHLIASIRAKILGETLWRDKMAHFDQQRKALGVVLV